MKYLGNKNHANPEVRGTNKKRRRSMKAERLDIGTLVVLSAYAKRFKTGSDGFQGKVLNPSTGKRYQVTAVRIGSKNGNRK